MSRCIRARRRLRPKLWLLVINCLPSPGDTPLQGLVHAKILKGVQRASRGGYQLARERRRITVGEIVRTAMSLSTADPDDLGSNSVLLERVIDPALRRAGETCLGNLDVITVEQMCDTAEKTHVLDDEKVSGDFCNLMPVSEGARRR